MNTLQITTDNRRFFIAFPYDPALVTAVKELPMRRWDPVSKHWSVPIDEAQALADFIKRVPLTVDLVGESEALLQRQAEAAKEAVDASKATHIDADLLAPEGLQYLPFQRAGIQYAAQRDATLIADEMGLGKTIQAIGVANVRGSATVLIICPASLRLNWLFEWRKWDTHNRAATIVSSAKQAWPTAPVVIINYDLVTKFPQVRSQRFDLLIADESHYLKNPKAQRTKAVLGYWDKAKQQAIPGVIAMHRLFLTGTPILNRPIEMYPVLKSIAPQEFGNWRFFTQKYCDAVQGRYGIDLNGASNLGELQERLRRVCMVRRLKADVLKELPAKRRQIIALEGGARIVSKESKAWAAYQDRIEEATAQVELAKASDDDDDYTRAVAALNALTGTVFTEMAKLRHDTALQKVPFAIEFLNEALETSSKIIVFAHHRDVIAKLAEAFPGIAVTLTGDTSIEARQVAVERFQNDESCKLFLGNIRAAGVGLTLTAASHVVFVEEDWVPANMTQAEDRAHRIGQENSVLVQHLVLDGSLDALIAKRALGKEEMIDDALDNDVDKNLSVIPVRDFAETSKREIDEEAEKLTTEDVEKYHRGLRIIAGMCDGAVKEDGRGFNKIDTHIGRQLAAQKRLTKRQAVIAKRLCTKYRRQIEMIGC